MNTITIIMPIYNCEKYIERSVRSIFAQSFHNIEFIGVNDGSTDCTLDLLDKLYNECPDNIDMRIITQENGGICAARNRGLEEATGKYIAFMDDDDFIPPYYIANLVKKIEEDNSEVVIGGCLLEDEVTGKLAYRNLNPNMEWDILRNNAPWGRIFSKKVIDAYNIRFFPTKISEDLYFNMVYLSFCTRITTIEQTGYQWAIRKSSESHNNFNSFADDRNICLVFDAILRDSNPNKLLDDDLFKYAIIKHSVWYLLFIAKKTNYQDLSKACAMVFDWLQRMIPNYRKNKYLSFFKPKGEALSIRLIVKISVILQDIGLFMPLLKIYGR